MDYPEWVDRVMKAFAMQWRETTGSSLIVGLDQHEVELALQVTDDIGREAVGDALRDLESLGLIEARAAAVSVWSRRGASSPRRALTGLGSRYSPSTLTPNRSAFFAC